MDPSSREQPWVEPDAIDPVAPPLRSPTLAHQWWRDVSFLHWRVDASRVADLLPPGVRPDVIDGSTWVGLIPFRMSAAGPGGRWSVPWAGDFLEYNVRLYSVDERGRRGIVFLSLDAQRLLVVAGVNAALRIPYRWARMSCAHPAPGLDPSGERLVYTSVRRAPGRARTHLEVEVGEPIGRPSELDHFLTARFGAHTHAWGRTWWVPVTHAPWPLRRARARVVDDELVAAAGLPGLSGSAPDSVLFSSGVHVLFGRPERV
ncbi:YqjF family protein [Nocardioides sp. cx-173]|uniref:YqjF family protein n=1 Tax=Nocardioides sp. cx-173 TaxID=2898796 RepID=UPI001E58714F|nr:DUF2071 domain-containing protein [Nocardioides sp. cx-173]MCD4524783.1 DUF2071 domain-containing protein [Nocardioides sp. cx-173]UGB43291.1 DUF2071 domain-containing protein [Nocardioides sp. cx-173]